MYVPYHRLFMIGLVIGAVMAAGHFLGFWDLRPSTETVQEDDR